MRNLIALAAILGLAGWATGFSAPKSNYQLGAERTTRQQSGLFPIPQRKAACSYNNKLQMTSDESLEEATTSNDATTEAVSTNGSAVNGSAVSTNGSTESSDSTAVSESKSEGFRWILLPTLLFKFTIVLAVKFATDAIVFPLLWSYRLARLGKRKIVRGVHKLFGGGKDDISTMKVNGDS